MRLSEIKEVLTDIDKLEFKLPSGKMVPINFHVTEVGILTKKFIDCGGQVRTEKKVNFQLWQDELDIDHRLKPQKLLDIINLSERKLDIGDYEVEVEYQSETIGKYGLKFKDHQFLLTTTETDCLAKDMCGIPATKSKDLPVAASQSCGPGSGCC